METYVLYELEQRPDGTIGIGNSIEANESDAVMLVQNGKAKFEGYAIGVFPEQLIKSKQKKGGEAEV
jgi:hypothetical protein